MKDGKLLAYEGTGTQGPGTQVAGGVRDLPKGVTIEQHAKLEKPQTPNPKPALPALSADRPQTISNVQIPKFLPAVVSHEQHPLTQELEEIIDQIVKDSAVTFSDPVLLKRFRMIVSARLRDVRDLAETKAMLLRNQKVGGLEIGEAEIDRVSAVMEKAFQSFQMKWKEVEMKRLKDWKNKQAQEREAREGQKGKQEQDELEERYKRLVGASGVGQPVSRQQPAQKTQSVRPASEPLLGAHPRSPSAPARSDSAALLPQVAAAKQYGEKKEEKKLLVPPRPTITPMRSPIAPPKPIQPTTPNTYLPAGKAGNLTPKPSQKLTDIRPAPKLLGPVEELSHLTLEDFRRIGTNPAESVARVEQKIMRLKSESLLRANQGMTAWRSSPLYQQYSQIMNEALSKRMSPDAVLEQKPSLTPPEFHAIMELNQKLRF